MPHTARLVVSIAVIVSLIPFTWAIAFPEPNDRTLCPPISDEPPRLSHPPEQIETDAPVVRILNPLALATPVEISDKYDGTDRRYHITAVALDVPDEAIVEAYVSREETKMTLGTLCPVPGTADTFQGFWDIPDSFPEGMADLQAKVFDRPGDGAQDIASDQVRVDVQHLDTGGAASENVALQWPLNDGPFGFYRNKAGEWKANVEALGGKGVTSFDVRYSTSPLSGILSFKACGSGLAVTTRESDGSKIVKGSCKLAAGDRPSSVTALAVTAQKGGPESSDVHRVHPFVQDPSEMKVTIKEITPTSLNRTGPSGRRRVAGSNCLEFAAHVVDRFDRPVVGANVDAEIRGPSDGGSFGDPVNNDATAPDQAVVTEPASTCSGSEHATLKQAHVIVADGPDARAIESANVGTTDLGQWRFKIFAPRSGQSLLKAWVDDESLVSDTSDRPADNDRHDLDEPSGSAEAQWLDDEVDLEFSPRGEAAPIGACLMYRVRVTGGDSVLDDFNVDLHLILPDPTLKVCGVDDEVLKPPDEAHAAGPTHPAPTNSEDPPSPCPDKDLSCIHVEGVTDGSGELVFGLSSDVSGQATMTAWADGEPGADTDLPTSQKAQIKIVTNWVSPQVGPSVELLSHPSIVEEGTSTRISTDSFTVLARVDAPYLGQDLSISVGNILLGEATRVGHSDLYVFDWDLTQPLRPAPEASPSPSPSSSPSPSPTPSPTATAPVPVPSVTPPVPLPSPTLPPGPKIGVAPGVPDGNYRLVASLEGGGSDGIDVQVNRSFDPTRDNLPAYEWAEVTFPKNGDPLSFVDGETVVEGIASGETGGVDLWYLIVGTTTWKPCGYRGLAGTGITETQPFLTSCRLDEGDRPADVVGVAATAFDCNVPTTGCADHPPAPPAPGVPVAASRDQSGAWEASGIAAVPGCDGSPCISLQPSRWRAVRETCVPMSVHAAKLNKPAIGQEVVLEFKGPTDRIQFCDPLNPVDRTWPGKETVEADPFGPDVHRVSGKTDVNGMFAFGVYSADSTFESVFSLQETASSRLTAWSDDGDGRFEPGESRSRAVFHWEMPLRCSIVGTERPEILLGTVDDDVICGRGGDDEIQGQEGDDIILGGAGSDTIFGDEGSDLIFGEAGDDVISGGLGGDEMHGGDGEDTIRGGSGHDLLFGQNGDDRLFGQRNRDALDGGPGEDHCDTGKGKKDSVVGCESVAGEASDNESESERRGSSPETGRAVDRRPAFTSRRPLSLLLGMYGTPFTLKPWFR